MLLTKMYFALAYFVSILFLFFRIRSPALPQEYGPHIRFSRRSSPFAPVTPLYLNYTVFNNLDRKYGNNDPYVKKLRSLPQLRHMSNEKECFHRLVPYELKPSHLSVCSSVQDVKSFFSHYKLDLQFECHDKSPYSHCQYFYLLIYDSKKRSCHSFRRKPCMLSCANSI